MANLCYENLETAVAIFMGDKKRDRRRFGDIEKVTDEIEEAVSYYVAKLSQQDVTATYAGLTRGDATLPQEWCISTF